MRRRRAVAHVGKKLMLKLSREYSIKLKPSVRRGYNNNPLVQTTSLIMSCRAFAHIHPKTGCPFATLDPDPKSSNQTFLIYKFTDDRRSIQEFSGMCPPLHGGKNKKNSPNSKAENCYYYSVMG